VFLDAVFTLTQNLRAHSPEALAQVWAVPAPVTPRKQEDNMNRRTSAFRLLLSLVIIGAVPVLAGPQPLSSEVGGYDPDPVLRPQSQAIPVALTAGSAPSGADSRRSARRPSRRT